MTESRVSQLHTKAILRLKVRMQGQVEQAPVERRVGVRRLPMAEPPRDRRDLAQLPRDAGPARVRAADPGLRAAGQVRRGPPRRPPAGARRLRGPRAVGPGGAALGRHALRPDARQQVRDLRDLAHPRQDDRRAAPHGLRAAQPAGPGARGGAGDAGAGVEARPAAERRRGGRGARRAGRGVPHHHQRHRARQRGGPGRAVAGRARARTPRCRCSTRSRIRTPRTRRARCAPASARRPWSRACSGCRSARSSW